jgi:hypothetical protein
MTQYNNNKSYSNSKNTKTPMYLSNRPFTIESRMYGVLWFPNFPPYLPEDHSINNNGIPITRNKLNKEL